MTDSTPESGAEQVKAEQPTPTFTETSPVSSPSGLDAKSLAQEVAGILMPEIERKLQSTKDKRIAKIEKALGSTDLSELEEMGVAIPENVRLEYRLRNLEAQKSAPVQEPSPAKGGTQDSEKVAAVIKDAGLDANTPEVISLLSGQYRNVDHFAAEAYKLKVRLANRPAPSAADAPVPQSPPATPVDDAGKIAELARLQKEPTRNMARIKQLKKELNW